MTDDIFMAWKNLMNEFADGYLDGRDKNAPEPNENRHPAYAHSFWVGRSEINGIPMSASVSRKAAESIIIKLGLKDPTK